MRPKSLSEQLDARFDAGDDILDLCDLGTARVVNPGEVHPNAGKNGSKRARVKASRRGSEVFGVKITEVEIVGSVHDIHGERHVAKSTKGNERIVVRVRSGGGRNVDAGKPLPTLKKSVAKKKVS